MYLQNKSILISFLGFAFIIPSDFSNAPYLKTEKTAVPLLCYVWGP